MMITIRRRDHAQRMARFYRLALQGVLDIPIEASARAPDAVPVDLIREWGRIGSAGTVRAEHHADEALARAALDHSSTAKRRRGYR